MGTQQARVQLCQLFRQEGLHRMQALQGTRKAQIRLVESASKFSILETELLASATSSGAMVEPLPTVRQELTTAAALLQLRCGS